MQTAATARRTRRDATRADERLGGRRRALGGAVRRRLPRARPTCRRRPRRRRSVTFSGEQRVDGRRGEDVLDRQHGGADDAGMAPRRGGDDAQVGGGQRQRASVHDLADAGEQRVAGLGERAADDDDARVEQADGAGQHLADRPPGIANQADRLGRPGTGEGDDVAARCGLDSQVAQRPGDRRPGGDRLEAPDVAAPAHGRRVAGHLHVAEVAGSAAGTAAQRPVADDAAADAGRHLDEHEVVDVREAQEAFAEGHHVDVVVDDDVGAQRLTHESRRRRSRPSRA